MAKVTVMEFEAVLRADEALRQKYEEALKGVTEAANVGEAMQKAAAQLGYELSIEELEQAWAAAQKLDGTELDAVAGGSNTQEGLNSQADDWCVLSYHCFTIASHDEVRGRHYEACWSDYYCMIGWNHS